MMLRKKGMNVITKGGLDRFSLEEHFKILGCVMKRQGKTLDASDAICKQGVLERHQDLQE